MTDNMNERHILSAFDRDLESVLAKIMKMGGLVEKAIHDGVQVLIDRDADRAQTIRAADKVIDALEEEVIEDTAKIIALRSPTAIDLRLILSVMRISGHLERIGDYSKNIAKRSQVIEAGVALDNAAPALRRMSREVELMLKDALDAYVQRDGELAMSVISRDEEVDQMYNALFREFLTYMMEEPKSITACMHLHFIAKNCERMGDHVTAICEEVVYLTTGTRPDGGRPKADLIKSLQTEH